MPAPMPCAHCSLRRRFANSALSQAAPVRWSACACVSSIHSTRSECSFTWASSIRACSLQIAPEAGSKSSTGSMIAAAFVLRVVTTCDQVLVGAW
jgi:hypothetical protein